MKLTSALFALTLSFTTSAFAAPYMVSEISAIPNSGSEPEAAPLVGGNTQLLWQSPNQSNGIFSDVDCDFCTGLQQSIGENFYLDQERTISQARFWGGYYPDNLPLATDDFTIFIHQDNAGLPGGVIYSAAGLEPQRTPTGIQLFGVDEYEYLVDLPMAPTLPSGTYWMQIYNNSAGNTDSWFWEVGNPDIVNGIPGSAYAFEAPGITWNFDAVQDLALELIEVHAANYVRIGTHNGAPKAADCATPEQHGRLIVDSTNNRLYFCSTAGWMPLSSIP